MFFLANLHGRVYSAAIKRISSHADRLRPQERIPPQSVTETRLVDAAVRLFAGKWYGIVSVAEICREAGLSNGVFYRYFHNKEALFRRILGDVLDMIRQVIEAAGGTGADDRLRRFIDVIVGFSWEHRDLVSVFREGQYRFFEYERQLAAIYQRGLGAALGREARMSEYLFALGGVRFCAVRRALHGVDIKVEDLHRILRHGLFAGMAFDPGAVFGGPAQPLPIVVLEGARDRMLASGRRLLGEKGYYATNIHEITGGAGLSVGAFYTYFASKDVFYAELIRVVGHEVRSFIARNLAPSGFPPLNRLERELRGLWLWLVYLSIDRNCYAIVREAEFVLPAAVRDYYGAFVEGYRKNPEGNGDADQATAIEFLLGIAHYLGIEAAFDGAPANTRALVEAIGGHLQRGFSDWLA
jgi:AcrR family transcriptional regulator